MKTGISHIFATLSRYGKVISPYVRFIEVRNIGGSLAFRIDSPMLLFSDSEWSSCQSACRKNTKKFATSTPRF